MKLGSAEWRTTAGRRTGQLSSLAAQWLIKTDRDVDRGDAPTVDTMATGIAAGGMWNGNLQQALSKHAAGAYSLSFSPPGSAGDVDGQSME